MKTIASTYYEQTLHLSSGVPIFILDNLRSAFNVGSVFRTLESISPSALFLSGICCRPGNRKLAHTSRGTHALVPWRYFADVHDAADWAARSGRRLVAVENTEDAVPLWDADFSLSDAFMLGNEAEGLDETLRERADLSVYFPQNGLRDCINVSSTAAIVAAEIMRRRFALE